jgi:hypothetical protein
MLIESLLPLSLLPPLCSIVLRVATPLSIRRLCAQTSAISPIGINSALGNFIASSDSYAYLTLRSSSAPRLWAAARAYIDMLRTTEAHCLESVGLLALVDPRAHVAGEVAAAAAVSHGRNGSAMVSNLGDVEATHSLLNASVAACEYTLEDMYFAQPKRYTSAVFSVCAVSCARGGMRLSMPYPNIVSEQEADRFKAVYEQILERVSQGQDPALCELAETFRLN